MLGYCLFPLNVVAFANVFLSQVLPLVVKIILVGIGFGWSTYCKLLLLRGVLIAAFVASVGFIAQMVPEDRKALAVFPVFLFYLFLSWFILL